MAQAKAGDKVKVHYTGKLGDGSVFDTSADREPLEFTVGGGQVIKGFDTALIDMKPGEVKVQVIPVEEAYGAHSAELVTDVPRERFPADMELEIGQQLQVGLADGQQAIVMVVDLKEDAVTLDANHPLAGQELTFEIELVEIA
ncbi:peptidylprolyl isomerase [Chlorobium sp. N1]|uniref:FKBP-type peptidyl-prolyl cis-trans isomerase n=1 Tax=Chlorobium sp. N1 TaxID=2491138 RepID=UPI00103D0F74|nr:peptidylprolyl isomerase [Chlorobium sp. N1]TCD47870.1 peptidylprolyl isomerase [Chlorobium sp. N1]